MILFVNRVQKRPTMDLHEAPGQTPLIGENPENALYETWKKASEAARPPIEQALVPLLYRHASKVCWMVLHSNQPDLIGTIINDVFLGMRKFKGDSLFSTWVHALALYRCRAELRNIRRRKEVNGIVDGGVSYSVRGCQETSSVVQNLVSKLGKREQELVRLKIDEGLSDKEIAEVLELHPVYIQRLWKALRKRLRSMYGRKAS
jgi:RNA polymerase sigma factor (sigma-70 family)